MIRLPKTAKQASEVTVMERRHERRARNEALLREVNERIEQVDKEAEARSWARGKPTSSSYASAVPLMVPAPARLR